jgi:hypothetical protein
MSTISASTLRARLPALAKRLDLKSLRVAVLLLAVAILNVLDLLLTIFAHSINQLNEVNPFTGVFLQAGLFPSFICFKILMVFCGVGILWKMRFSRLTIPACWVLLISYAWLGLVWIQWVRTINQTYEFRLTSALP